MAHQHILSPVDHHLDECIDCGVLIPGLPPPPAPDCTVDGCDNNAPVLGPDGQPICVWHDPRLDLTAHRRKAA